MKSKGTNKIISKALLPNILPRARSSAPIRKAARVAINSGSDVASATKVVPINVCPKQKLLLVHQQHVPNMVPLLVSLMLKRHNQGMQGVGDDFSSSLIYFAHLIHEKVDVQAEIVSLHNFSAHADWQDSIEWVKKMPQEPARIILNHGEKKRSKV